MTSIYNEIIKDAAKHPRHKGLREPYDVEVFHENTTCGDKVWLRVRIAGGVVEDISYETDGCTISRGSEEIMVDLLLGKPVEHGFVVADRFTEMLRGGEADEDVLEDAIAFQGVAKLAMRVKCAQLGWMAWKDATARALAKEDA